MVRRERGRKGGREWGGGDKEGDSEMEIGRGGGGGRGREGGREEVRKINHLGKIVIKPETLSELETSLDTEEGGHRGKRASRP